MKTAYSGKNSMLEAINPTGVFLRLAFVVMFWFGGAVGLYGLLSPFVGYPLQQSHILQHIHLQVWYFLGGFILAAGYRLLPQLTGVKLKSLNIPVVSSLLYLLSAFLLIFYFPFTHGDWGVSTTGMGIFVLAEWLVWGAFVITGLKCLLKANKKGPWRWVASGGLLGFGLFMGMSGIGWLGLSDWLTVEGDSWIRKGAKGALFVAIPLLAMGISGQVLRKKDYPDVPYVIGVLLVITGTLDFSGVWEMISLNAIGPYALIAGFPFLFWGMKLHRVKKTLNIKGFQNGVAIAFVFVLLFALFNLLQQFFTLELIQRSLVHVWAMGFLTSLIMAFSTWVVPAAAQKGPIHSPWLTWAIYGLAFGTLIRVFAPLLFEPGGVATMNMLLLVGGTLQYLTILVFAVVLWPRMPKMRN